MATSDNWNTSLTRTGGLVATPVVGSRGAWCTPDRIHPVALLAGETVRQWSAFMLDMENTAKGEGGGGDDAVPVQPDGDVPYGSALSRMRDLWRVAEPATLREGLADQTSG